MIDIIDTIKSRNILLLDELRRIEGAIRENTHLLSLFEKSSQIEIDSVEKIN